MRGGWIDPFWLSWNAGESSCIGFCFWRQSFLIERSQKLFCLASKEEAKRSVVDVMITVDSSCVEGFSRAVGRVSRDILQLQINTSPQAKQCHFYPAKVIKGDRRIWRHQINIFNNPQLFLDVLWTMVCVTRSCLFINIWHYFLCNEAREKTVRKMQQSLSDTNAEIRNFHIVYERDNFV